MAAVLTTGSTPSNSGVVQKEKKSPVKPSSPNNNEIIHFKCAKFLRDAGLKLSLPTLVIASAANLYHRFFDVKSDSLKYHDPYTIATSCLYLASKSEEKPVKLKYLIMTCHRLLHQTDRPLETSEEIFWDLRDSIVTCELYILRHLGYNLQFDHPFKYLIQYIKLLEKYFDRKTLQSFPLGQKSWSVLVDSYLGEVCIRYSPRKLAMGAIAVTLSCYEDQLQNNAGPPVNKWWQVIDEDISLNELEEIESCISHLYLIENNLNPTRRPSGGQQAPGQASTSLGVT